jgi:hypothetical protein
MKMLRGRSWAYLIGAGAGAALLALAGGAWADDIANPPAQPTPQTQPAEQAQPAPQATPPAAPKQEAPAAGMPDQGQPAAGQPAAGSSKPVESAALTTESSATVTAIDKADRHVTLKDPAGDKFVVSVPKDVKGFDTLKTGDKIDIDYYSSVALSILPPGSKAGETERMGSMAGGGAEAMGKALTVTAKVVNVDSEANEVTFKGPHGVSKTVKVQDPDLQKKLPDLKAGDSVQLTFTEAAAADIRPAAAK